MSDKTKRDGYIDQISELYFRMGNDGERAGVLVDCISVSIKAVSDTMKDRVIVGYDSKRQLEMIVGLCSDLYDLSVGVTGEGDGIFSRGLDLIRSKSNDYAGDDDPFSNFREVEKLGLSLEMGILVRMTDKVSRLRNLYKGKTMEVNEKIEDTIMDLSNYAAILHTYLSGGSRA
jgi:hypothetical protein